MHREVPPFAEAQSAPEAPAAARPSPTPASERISAMDALRGLVLLGILFMNIPGFGLPHWADWNPRVAGGDEGADWWAWFLGQVFVSGKMRGLFSMLFGAGAWLLTRRAEESGLEGKARVADIYHRRMLWLIVFGIIDGYLLCWPGDILYWYGLIGLLVFPFRKLKSRTLIIIAMCLFVLGIAFRVGETEFRRQDRAEAIAIRADVAAGRAITEEQKEKLEEWDDGIKEDFPPPKEVEKEIEKARSGYFKRIATIAPVTTELNSEPIYMDFDVLPMMLLGLAFAKAGVITNRRSTRFYVVMALACLPLGWFIAGLRPLAFSRSGFDPESIAPYSQGQAWGYITSRVLVSLGYLAVVMLAARAAALAAPMRAIAAAGRMPLTNYLGQSLICLIIFTGVGFAMFNRFSRSELMLIALAIWTAQVVFSVVWMQRHAFGPMEWLWRWLAYREKPAWRADGRE